MNIKILQHNIFYWYENDQEMPDHEEEHVKNCIIEGYSSGQLVCVDHETEKETIGWWEIK